MTESPTTPEPARPPHTDGQVPPVAPPVPGAVPPLPEGAPPVPPRPADPPRAEQLGAEAAGAEVSAASGEPAHVPLAPPSGHSAPEAAPALDRGTYTAVREPRGQGRLALDGHWHQISPKYVVSQTVQNAIFAGLVIAAMLVVGLALDQPWVWWPGAALLVVTLITQLVLPRQARALGYMLREDDIVFRKGILWQRIVAVPYGRMQLVDITHGPMDRAFGIAKLKMVTAAATTGVEIPGLSQEAAEALRDTLIQVAETRRTGL